MTIDPNARGDHLRQDFTIDPEHAQQAEQVEQAEAREGDGRPNHLDDRPAKPYGTGESGQGGFALGTDEGPH